jgi:hypothetical protein
MNNRYNNVFASDEVNGKKVEVLQDTDPLDPRNFWDHDSLMLCFHKRYNLGDKNTGYNEADFDNWQEVYDQLRLDDYQTILALYLYDHSGISINARSFLGRAPHAEWDSGQVGFIAHKEANKEDLLMAEVDEYDHYLTGEVYAYRVYENKTCDSCNHMEEDVQEYSGGYLTVEEALQAGKEVA